MTILYYGGQKSGKSRLAETKALELAHGNKPYYVATYDNSYGDSEMHARIARHPTQLRVISLKLTRRIEGLLLDKRYIRC